MEIKGKIVTLRAMRSDDMQMICDMFNDADLENCVVGWAFPISIDQQKLWFDSHMNDHLNQRFIIDTVDNGAVGVVSLTEIDWKNRKALYGIKLCGEKNMHKGIGTDALMAMERYVFDELGFHRLESIRFETNIASKKMLMKCGWKDEGLMRECIYKKGEWKNLIMTSILESDYRRVVEETKYWG